MDVNVRVEVALTLLTRDWDQDLPGVLRMKRVGGWMIYHLS